MNSLYRWPMRDLALLLLGSCNPHHNEQPIPTKAPAPGLEIAPLRRAFLAQHYDAQLIQRVNNQNQPNSVWTWTPLWDRAIQTTVPDSTTPTCRWSRS